MLVDAHQHFWHYDPSEFPWIGDGMEGLLRDFLPGDLAPILTECGIEGTVLVQARQSEAETRFLLEIAETNPFVRGVVGWVDLKDEAVGQVGVLGHPALCGVRHIIHDEPDVDFMLDPAFRRGVATLAGHNLTYDLLLFPEHLANARILVAENAEIAFVLDHIGKPPIRASRQDTAWGDDIRRLAELHNVMCKVSGMVTEADWVAWKTEDMSFYLDTVFDAFGPDRVMFGSDWPVCLLAADYGEVLQLVRQFVADESAEVQNAVFGGNAARFYGLGPD